MPSRIVSSGHFRGRPPVGAGGSSGERMTLSASSSHSDSDEIETSQRSRPLIRPAEALFSPLLSSF